MPVVILPLAEPLLDPLLNTLPEQAVPVLLEFCAALLVWVEFSACVRLPLAPLVVLPPL